jgi:oligopeptide transport system substrate-binding protein
MRLQRFTLICFFIFFFLSMCSSGPKESIKLSLNIVSEPHSLDTRRLRTLTDISIANMIYEGLFRTTKEGLVKALAEDYSIDETETLYHFKLKKSFWSNGKQIVAQDFIRSYKSLLHSDFPSDYAFLLYYIKGAEKIKKGRQDMDTLGVKALDETTLEFQLIHPIPFFLELLALPIFFPTSGSEGVYNGPFCLFNWFHNYQITLTKNNHYWDKGAVHIDKVELHMCDNETGLQLFEKGQLDLEGSPFGSIPPDSRDVLAKEGKLTTHPILGTQWIRVNTSRDELSNPIFRKAIATAIHRKDLCEHILFNSQVPSLRICPNSLTKTLYQDGGKEVAKDLLNRCPQTRVFTLTYAASPLANRIAQAIQSQLDGVGIQIQLERLEPKVFFSRISKKDYDLALGNWIADVPDPLNFLQNFRTSDTGTNNTFWENSEFKDLIDKALFCKGEERIKVLEAAEEILLEASPVIPLYQMSMQYVKSPRLKGIHITDLGLIDIKGAYFSDED